MVFEPCVLISPTRPFPPMGIRHMVRHCVTSSIGGHSGRDPFPLFPFFPGHDRPTRAGSDDDRQDVGEAQEVQRLPRTHPQRPQRLPGKEATVLPTLLLPVQRRVARNPVRNKGTHCCKSNIDL